MATVNDNLANALIVSRWWPPDDPHPESLRSLQFGDDLLPLLREGLERRLARASKSANQRTLAQQTMLDERLAESGAMLTFGWPGLKDQQSREWIGSRLLWWPNGIPSGRKVAWVSSRLGRAIDERPDWFAVLRSAAAKLDPARDLLLTAPSTTTDRFLERAAILFGLRLLRVQLDETHSLSDWLTRLRRQLLSAALQSSDNVAQRTDDEGMIHTVNVSPIIEGTDTGHEPLADRVLVAAADRILTLQLRPHGNLHALLTRRLSDPAWPAGSVWLALGERLVPSEVADDLQSLGAVGWSLWPKAPVVQAASLLQPSDQITGEPPVLRVFRSTEMPWPDGSYLVHWTRRCFGPWPEQSATDFVDDLLLSRGEESHSAFATLVRIVRQQRLIASSTGNRGTNRVVSFSATPLSELLQRRTFRKHRGRWDFELSGVCIRRERLEQFGTRPVIYGDDSEWAALSEADRPFWQLRQTRARGGAKTIDWTAEAEWRILDDLDLSAIPREDVLLFVPSDADARQLAPISPWPIIVLGNDPASDGISSE